MTLREDIAKNIRAIRTLKGLSQSDLAKKAGLTPRYVTRIENDPQNLTIDNLERIAAVLEVSVGQILGTPNQPPIRPEDAARELDQAIKLLQAYRSLV